MLKGAEVLPPPSQTKAPRVGCSPPRGAFLFGLTFSRPWLDLNSEGALPAGGLAARVGRCAARPRPAPGGGDHQGGPADDLRTPATGVIGPLFKAARIALPPNVRDASAA